MKTYPSLKSCDYLYICLGHITANTDLQVHSGQVSVGLVRGSEDCSCTCEHASSLVKPLQGHKRASTPAQRQNQMLNQMKSLRGAAAPSAALMLSAPADVSFKLLH